MTPATRKLLRDALEAGESILNHTTPRRLDDYKNDRFFRRAVEREFEIIGEALNRLSQVDPETAAKISELRRIVDFRNRIIHGYDTVDDVVVWGVIQSHLPKLVQELQVVAAG